MAHVTQQRGAGWGKQKVIYPREQALDSWEPLPYSLASEQFLRVETLIKPERKRYLLLGDI